MDRSMNIREGMEVVGEGNQSLGMVEKLHGDGFHVNGQHYGREQIARVAQNRIYLRGAGMAQGANDEIRGVEAPGPVDRLFDRDRDDKADILEGGADRRTTRGTTDTAGEGEVRVPVAEERLAVGTREADMGAVDIRKTVTEEQQTVPVTLHRDEVRVRQEDVAERPLQAGEDAFNEETIRIAVRGEEAVVAKETVVTGEVVIDKERVAEERQVTDTVRKQHVDVDENYRQARTDLEQEHTTRAAGGRTFEQAEPNYRSGFTAAHDERYNGREFEEAEPQMRSEYETNTTRTQGGDNWEQLREEIRSGWNRARRG